MACLASRKIKLQDTRSVFTSQKRWPTMPIETTPDGEGSYVPCTMANPRRIGWTQTLVDSLLDLMVGAQLTRRVYHAVERGPPHMDVTEDRLVLLWIWMAPRGYVNICVALRSVVHAQFNVVWMGLGMMQGWQSNRTLYNVGQRNDISNELTYDLCYSFSGQNQSI